MFAILLFIFLFFVIFINYTETNFNTIEKIQPSEKTHNFYINVLL